MKLPEMKTGLAISALLHAALLLWGLISFSPRAARGQAQRRAAGRHHLRQAIHRDGQGREERAEGREARRRWSRRSIASKPVDDPRPRSRRRRKIDDGAERAAAAAAGARAEAQAAEAKPEKKPEPPKVDPIAETLKKEEAKQEGRGAAQGEGRAGTEAGRRPNSIRTRIAALLDKREPQRQAAAGDRRSPNAVARQVAGQRAVLSQSEIDALRRRLVECWNPPVGAANARQPEGRAAGAVQAGRIGRRPPQLVAGTASPFGPAMAESAKRAILTCQPFKMLRPETLRAMERHRDHI